MVESEVSQSKHPYRLQFDRIRQILKTHRVGALNAVPKEDVIRYGDIFIRDACLETGRGLGQKIAEVTEPSITTHNDLGTFGDKIEIRYSGVFLSEAQCQDIMKLLNAIEAGDK